MRVFVNEPKDQGAKRSHLWGVRTAERGEGLSRHFAARLFKGMAILDGIWSVESDLRPHWVREFGRVYLFAFRI